MKSLQRQCKQAELPLQPPQYNDCEDLKAKLYQNINHTTKSPFNTKYIHNPIFSFVMFSSYYNY